jgi:hypothetical protein
MADTINSSSSDEGEERARRDHIARYQQKREEDEKARRPHIAFTIRKATEAGKKDAWTQIGVVFEHRDQKGLDVVLEALPVDGRVVPSVVEPRYEKLVRLATKEGIIPATTKRQPNALRM